MEPVGQLSPQDWLSHPDTRRVMAALAAQGARPRFVGGCVRDAVLNLPVADVDIAVDRPPAEISALLEAAGIEVRPTGLAHGTVTALTPSRRFEITALRRDVETDGRHAVVAFTDDWEADAARRDLTINALYADADGAIFDPCNGLADLGAGRVRFVGDPERRIREDVLRILRFFRFHARFGRGRPDPAAMEACRRLAPELEHLSGERIRIEMMGILAGADPAQAILSMRASDVLDRILPGEVVPGRLRLLAWLETRALRLPGLAPDPLRRLAALVAGADAAEDAARAEALALRWRLSADEKTRLVEALTLPPGAVVPAVDLSPAAARRLLHRLGERRFRDRILIAWADYRLRFGAGGPLPGSRGTAAWTVLLGLPGTRPVPPFPLHGRDLLDLGVPSGPAVGAWLSRGEVLWEESDFSLDRGALLERLAPQITAGILPALIDKSR